jgi:hypothetical protein
MVVMDGGGWRPRWRERSSCWEPEKDNFFLTLDTNLFSLRPWNPPLFIGGGREQSCLHWGKHLALDSVGKDPNRWLKVVMVHCQICTYMLPELASLGLRWSRCVVIRSKQTIPRGRGMLGDHLRASFVKFGEGYRH